MKISTTYKCDVVGCQELITVDKKETLKQKGWSFNVSGDLICPLCSSPKLYAVIDIEHDYDVVDGARVIFLTDYEREAIDFAKADGRHNLVISPVGRHRMSSVLSYALRALEN